MLQETGNWAVQFVSQGFFIPSLTYQQINNIAKPVIVHSLDAWEFKREINYQLLNHLASKSDVLRGTIKPSSVKAESLRLESLYGDLSDAAGARLISMPLETAIADSSRSVMVDSFKLDLLSLNDPGAMPEFGRTSWDRDVADDTFEYWIEDIVF
jgi:hypothetical protein